MRRGLPYHRGVTVPPDLEDLGPIETRCIACGAEIGRADDGCCPECGAAVALRIAIAGADGFNRALRELGAEGLLLDSKHPNSGPAGLGALVGASVDPIGYLWIDVVRHEEAAAALERAGVAPEGTGVPLVDRAEPICPRCDAPLAPHGPERCPACDARFTWVAIDEPEAMRLHRCRSCGHDLGPQPPTHCPECGADVPLDLDALADQATAEAPEPQPPRAATVAEPRGDGAPRARTPLVLGLLLGIVGAVQMLSARAGGASGLLGIALIVVALALLLGAVRRLDRR